MNDPRVVEVCVLIGKLFPGQRFFVGFAPRHQGEKISTMGNMPEPAQRAFLAALVQSFDAGTCERQEELVLSGQPPSELEHGPTIPAPRAELEPGDVVQLDPAQCRHGPVFALVDEVCGWGVKCSIVSPEGLAPYRASFGAFERIGPAQWLKP